MRESLRRGPQINQSDIEDSYRLLIESVEDYAIFLLDTNGYVVTWNKGAERIKGYSANEIIGQHFSVFYPIEDRESGKPEQILETAKKWEKSKTLVGGFERMARNSGAMWLLRRYMAQTESCGVLARLLATSRSVTKLRSEWWQP